MPNPLSRVSPRASAYFAPDALLQRSELAPLVAHVIGTWARCDYAIAALLTQFLKSDFKVVYAMYESLTSNEARRAVIHAAAQASLPSDRFELFQRVMRAVTASRTTRNDFVHKIWAISPEIPEALLLVDISDFMIPNINVSEMMAWKRQSHPKPESFAIKSLERKHILVYRKKELEHAVKQANLANQMLGRLHNALSDVPQLRDPQRIWIENALQSLQSLPPKSRKRTP